MTRSHSYAFVLSAGVFSAIAAAILWAVITAATGYRIGWMAVGVGFLVAFTIRLSADSHYEYLAYLSATLAFVGCLLGNYLSLCVLIADHEAISLTRVAFTLLPKFADVLTTGFRPMDVLYYGIAVYSGYKFGRVPMKQRAPERT